MTSEIQNRFRISTNFLIAKGVAYFLLALIVFALVRDIQNGDFNKKSTIGFVMAILAALGILYFVSRRKRIDYDDISQILYIVDKKNQTQIEVPVEKIDKILYSAIGGRCNPSYLIVYRDFHNQQQKVRLFPIMFDNTIDTIKTDTKMKNPNLEIRNWSFGWNELLD